MPYNPHIITMKKNISLLLTFAIAFSLIGCDGSSQSSSNDSSQSSSTKPSTSSSVSTTVQDSSSSSVEEGLKLDFSEEELAAARTYLETNKSACAIVDGVWNSYCTMGEKNISILHARKNQKNNAGDITIYDGSTQYIAPAEKLSDTDTYPDEEANIVFMDWKLNVCAVAASKSVYKKLCTDPTAKKYDDTNIWNSRLLVDETGDIFGIYPVSNQEHASLPEPYFSNYEYTKTSNDNYFIWDWSKSDRVQVAGTGADNHLYAWAVVPGGFTVAEHGAHGLGRYNSYKFVNSFDQDLLIYAFAGDQTSFLGLTSGFLEHATQNYINMQIVDNTEEVYYLSNIGLGMQAGHIFVPGQFDDVVVTQEAIKVDGETTGEYKVAFKFSYDPQTIYQKFVNYNNYLDTYFATVESPDDVIRNAKVSMESAKEVALEAIEILNVESVRTGSQLQEYSDYAYTCLDNYRKAIIALKEIMVAGVYNPNPAE